MQIDRVLYPVTTLGPGKRIGIWTIGCPHKCYNCSNPELWETNNNKEVEIENLMLYVSQYASVADGVTITGGDPFFQPDELYHLLKKLRHCGFKDILVYTGYKISDLSKKYNNILSLIDVVIDGPYIDFQNNNIGLKGSVNQGIYILNAQLSEKYRDINIQKRNRQNFVSNGKIISVGIPTKIKSKDKERVYGEK